MEIQKDLNISEIATAMIDDDIHTDTEGGATFSCSLNSRKDKSLNSSSENINPNFPQIPIRTNFKTLNEVIIRCIVQISADYNLPPSTASSILCDVGNTVFQQNWEKTIQISAYEKSNNDQDIISDDGDDDNDDDESKYFDCENSIKYTNIMPSRRTINRYIEDAAILNLKYVGDSIVNKSSDATCTLGLDDVKKAAGHQLNDAKSSHITIKASGKERTTLTTGFHANASHTGEASSEQVTRVLTMLSILSESSLDEVKQAIDFWMVDRAGDAKIMLDTLDIDEHKKNKCNAHIILCVDHAIYKYSFRLKIR